MAPPGTIIGQLTPTVPGSPSGGLGGSQQLLSQSLASQVQNNNFFQVRHSLNILLKIQQCCI